MRSRDSTCRRLRGLLRGRLADSSVTTQVALSTARQRHRPRPGRVGCPSFFHNPFKSWRGDIARRRRLRIGSFRSRVDASDRRGPCNFRRRRMLACLVRGRLERVHLGSRRSLRVALIRYGENRKRRQGEQCNRISRLHRTFQSVVDSTPNNTVVQHLALPGGGWPRTLAVSVSAYLSLYRDGTYPALLSRLEGVQSSSRGFRPFICLEVRLL